MNITLEHCGQHHQLDVSRKRGSQPFLRCPKCNQLIGHLDVSRHEEWIDQLVRRRANRQLLGKLGTRKQSQDQTDEEIDRDGLAAELAACLILCPGSVRRWQKAARRGRGNRGRDLRRRWTGLDKHVEVKQTTYRDEQRGHLIVRPPRRTPGKMRPEWIDDCYYVLMHGTPFAFQLCGWIDREELIREGQRNPIPVRPGQRDCWGIHWQKLRPLAELAARCS